MDETIVDPRPAVAARPVPTGHRRKAALAATVLWPLAAPAALAQDQAAHPAEAKPAAAAKPLAAKSITPGATASDAVGVLLHQADYWRSQYQPAKAIDALNRVLQIEPRNADALATLSQVQADQGNISAAQNALSRLKIANPADPRIDTIHQTLRVGPIDPNQLREARGLAENGRSNDAVGQYKKIFKGEGPTPGLATEYYSVLSGTDEGWDKAKQGLGDQVKANPQDLKAQLAYAQLLTYREGTRAEGITRLKRLAANPTTAAGATSALRQALLWLPDSASSAPALKAYLDQHGSDTEISQKLDAARHPAAGPADAAGEARVRAFADLNHGRLDRAADSFQSALRRNPNDGDALGGLGIVRLRQGRQAEARHLLDQAIRAQPGKKRQWQAALAGANGGGAAVGKQWDEVRRLAAAGNYDAAEQRLRPLLGRDAGNTGGLLLLADIQQRAGRIAAAESSYRTVLARQPANSAAVIGLAGILTREGRSGEADQLYAQAQAMGAKGAGQLRAQQLRAQAEEVTDPVAQAGLYRAAIGVDPSNPWLKLELARLLAHERRLDEARAVMQGVGLGRHASGDEVRAGLIFANETDDYALANTLIARIPPKARTAEMRRAVREAQVKAQIAGIEQMAYVNRPMARQQLLALAAAPDREGVNGTQAARAFLRMNDRYGVREAISTAMAANGASLSPDARVAFSGVLLQAGDTAAAASLASAAETQPMSMGQRQALGDIQAGIAVRSSDQLKTQGKIADAYDRLAPALERDPTDPKLNMALGRLYAANDQPKQALAINQALLRRDPNDFAVRQAAVDAAVQVGEYGQARRLAQDGLQLFPNDPRAWMTSARVAKAAGDSGRALHDYQMALRMREQQVGVAATPIAPAQDPLPASATLGPAPNILTVPNGGAPYAPMPGPAPMPLDLPRRMRQSSQEERDAVREAEIALPHMRLAQSRLPYYVSPAPELSPAPDASPVDAGEASPIAAAPSMQPYGAYPTPYQPSLPPPYQGGYAPYAPPPVAAPVADDEAPAPSKRHRHHASRRHRDEAGDQGYAQPYPAPAAPPAYPYAPPYQAYRQPAPPPAPPSPAYGAPGAMGGFGGVPDASPGFGYGNSYANPFRAGVGASPLGGPGPAGAPPAASLPVEAAPADPMAAEIGRNIDQLRLDMAPTVQAGVGIRFRTGSAGLSRLTEETLPLEATYSPGVGQLRLQVAPTFLQAGSVGGDPRQKALLGSNALYALSPATPGGGSQSASGVGLDVGYGWKWISADIGSTPLGFREQNAVGGIELAPQLDDNFRLRLTGERRAVTNSVLSYAGTVDPRTGQSWGGVVDTGGRAQIEYGKNGLNLYANAGGGVLTGHDVMDNTNWLFGAGGSYPVYRGSDDELRLGLDLVYFGYQNNQQFFSLGYGGYFSPQSYFATLVPITYRQTAGNLNWSVGASVGFQTFHQTGGDVFPNDGGLQAQLVALSRSISATSPNAPQITTRYGGTNDTGFAGGLQAEALYHLTKAWSVGGRAGVQHTGNFTEAGGLAFTRYAFGVE